MKLFKNMAAEYVLLILGGLIAISGVVVHGVKQDKREVLFQQFDSLQRESHNATHSRRRDILDKQTQIISQIKEIK